MASLSFQSVEQWDDAGYLPALVSLTRAVRQDRAFADMWSYQFLTEGLIDVVAGFDLDSYDIATLVSIIREAGSKFTNIEGVDSIWTGSVLASSGLLHEALLSNIEHGHWGL